VQNKLKEKFQTHRKPILTLLGLVILLVVILIGYFVFYLPTFIENQKNDVSKLTFSMTRTKRGGICPNYETCKDSVEVKDDLENKDIQEFKLLLTKKDFYDFRQSVFVGICPTAFDGTENIYDIELNGLKYQVGSCINDFDKYKLYGDKLKDISDRFGKKN